MIITLLTDFGDMYPASMKGVILRINPTANIVDISHSVPRHDIRSGAFVLMACARYFPSGTVHIAVVDPGVGTERRAIAIKAVSKEQGINYFVGPDNGILIPAARSVGDFEVYEITNNSLFNEEISSTFNGRDIFAPVGAHISRGIDICDVGVRIYDHTDMDFGSVKKKEHSIEGIVIFIDEFGNIITNIPSETVDLKSGNIMQIENKIVQFQRSYGFSKEREPLALIGSHRYLEIAVNRGNAANVFNKKQGDELIISRYP
jgi:S-adenosylmethionine hydrolase